MGGDLRGRRFKQRALVKYLDARRVMWEDELLRRNVLSRIPQAGVSGEVEPEGTLEFEPVLSDVEVEKEGLQRCPPTKLVGVQSDMVVRSMRINDVSFAQEMTAAAR